MTNLNHETLEIWFYAVVSDERVVLAQTEHESLRLLGSIDETVPEIGCSVFAHSKRLPQRLGCYVSEKTDDVSLTSIIFMQSLKQRCIEILEKRC